MAETLVAPVVTPGGEGDKRSGDVRLVNTLLSRLRKEEAEMPFCCTSCERICKML